MANGAVSGSFKYGRDIVIASGCGWFLSNSVYKNDNPDIITSVDENISSAPLEFALYQNYPNPFNPGTKIKFGIPNVGRRGSSTYNVTLKVFDVLGDEVSTIVNKELPAGEYEVDFNAANLPSGIYLYQLKAGDILESKKMLLLK